MLYTNQIFKLLAKRCKGTFLGLFARNKLPKVLPRGRNVSLIINTDPDFRRGQHWVAMHFKKNGTAEYFDSFGLPASVHPPFERYFKKHCRKWITNNRQIQSV